MGAAEFRGHCEFIIEVGKGAVGIFGAGIEDGLSCLLDFGFLGVGWGWPREVVVDDILRITVITLEPSAYYTHPGIVDIGCENSEMINGGIRDYNVCVG